MIKSKTCLEHVHNGKTYQLIVEPEAGLGEVYDVLNFITNYVVERMNQVIQQQKKQEASNEQPSESDCQSA